MTDDAILAVLRSMQTTLAEHSIALGQVRAVSVSLKLHGNMLNDIQQDVRDIRAAVSDMERTRLTVGETDAPSPRSRSLTRNSDCACGEGSGS